MPIAKLVLLLFVLSPAAHAAQSDDERQLRRDKLHVIAVDPDMNVESLRSQDVQVYPYRYGENTPSEDLLSAAERERVFAVSGMSAIVARFDDLEKDLLIHRARKLNAAELKRKYPKLPPEKLDTLQAEVRK